MSVTGPQTRVRADEASRPVPTVQLDRLLVAHADVSVSDALHRKAQPPPMLDRLVSAQPFVADVASGTGTLLVGLDPNHSIRGRVDFDREAAARFTVAAGREDRGELVRH